MDAMRTTIDIPDLLYRSMKARCASEGTTLRHVIVALSGDWMQRPDWHPRIETKFVPTAEPKRKRRLSCLGILKPRKNAQGPHDMESIRESIIRGRVRERAQLSGKREIV